MAIAVGFDQGDEDIAGEHGPRIAGAARGQHIGSADHHRRREQRPEADGIVMARSFPHRSLASMPRDVWKIALIVGSPRPEEHIRVNLAAQEASLAIE
jgi:hypothetical protein